MIWKSPPPLTEILVVVDNNPYRSDLKTSWGVSIYINHEGTRLLFDTGPSSSVLLSNAEKLRVGLKDVDFVAVSHNHGDHTGGLSAVAGRGLKVYIPAHSGLAGWVEKLGLMPVPVKETMKVGKDIYIIGELPPIYEQALGLKSKKGIVLLVGCSHPGVEKIARKATEELEDELFLVIGGFHTSFLSYSRCTEIVDVLVRLGARKIYPIHCSGSTMKSAIKSKYPDRFGEGGVGLDIKID